MEELTPMMRQYLDIKRIHKDEILFFRLGDFYEMFFDDAKTAARVLNLTLTARGAGATRVPMAGIPYHAAENYIGRLVKNGFSIAIFPHIKGFDFCRVVGQDDRLFAEFFGKVPLMFRLQIGAPCDGVLEGFARFFKDLYRFRIGHMGKGGLCDMAQPL